MNKGFTFIELLLILIILGGIVVVFLPRYAQTVKKEHEQQVHALEQARQLQNALNNRAQLQQRQMDSLDGSRFVLPSRPGPKRATK